MVCLTQEKLKENQLIESFYKIRKNTPDIYNLQTKFPVKARIFSFSSENFRFLFNNAYKELKNIKKYAGVGESGTPLSRNLSA